MRFRTVALDVDSTCSRIEGIDWLAALRGPEMAREIADLTAQAMSGEVPLGALYGRRLALVRPTTAEVAALSEAYREDAAPGVREGIAALQQAGVTVHLISGGLREAIVPFAEWLGVPSKQVHAVRIYFDAAGQFGGWDEQSPLATADGKGVVLGGLQAPSPRLMVGDGATDLAATESGASFAAFVGFVHREPVVSAADHVVGTFEELRHLVLS